MHRWDADASAFWQFGLIYGRAAQSPEKRLLAAVLMDALLQFEKVRRPRGRREVQALDELRAWFYGADEDWPFSFENVCAHLNLEPDAIRARLARVSHTREARAPHGGLSK